MKINLSGLVLLTGKPGAGKSLRMMQYLEQAIAEGRPCYVSNVEGLNMAGAIPFEDPRQWRDIPAGGVLFVDEAQRFFRARRGMMDPPEFITAMETIRHDSVCIVMTTQQPTYLDKHVRGLIGHHEHLIELIAGYQSNVYTFRECQEEVTDGAKAGAQFDVWVHPRKLHAAYKSAEQHTKKARIPRKVLLLGAGVLVAVGGLVYAFMPHEKSAEKETALGVHPPGQFRAVADSASGNSRPADPLDYAELFSPRFANQPKSAPAYDGLPVVAEPQIVCMTAGPGKDAQGKFKPGRCRCLTEQGTRWQMPDAMCRETARFGPSYDPFKRPRNDGGVMQSASVGAAVDGAGGLDSSTGPIGIGEVRGQVPAQGSFRNEPTSVEESL